MIVPADIQAISQMTSSSAGSSAGSAQSFTMPNLPDPDPAAAQMFAQTMSDGSTPSVTPVDTNAAMKVSADAAANISDIDLPESLRFFQTLTVEDLFLMKRAISTVEFEEIRTRKFSELTGQALDSVTKQSE